MLEAQRLASLAIAQVLAGRSLSNLRETHLSERDRDHDPRPLAQELTYGTLRHFGRLDALLRQLLHQPVQHAPLRALLLVGLYQLENSRLPDFAVVDSAVRCAAALHQPRAKALVNAVLRGFQRRSQEMSALIAQDEVAHYSYPKWWIEQVKQEYPRIWPEILLAGNAHPPMTLRVNARHMSAATYIEELARADIAARQVGASAVMLAQAAPIAKLPGFREGWVSVQDLSAQHAAPLLDARDGMRVLDACAAPGGKTGHLLELAQVDLLALDHDAARLARVEQNLARLALTARVVAADAAQPSTWWDGAAFDRILLDVPCSGSGVVKRHPDIKWLRRVADIPQFAAQQARLLHALWPCLSVHGKLLYVSCSIFGEENDHQIRQFLVQHTNARRLPITIPGSASRHVGGQICPDELHDGFFYALLEKT